MFIRRTESKGRTYYRVVESRWVGGRAVQANVVSLGDRRTVGGAIVDRRCRAKGLAGKPPALERVEGEIALLLSIIRDVPPLLDATPAVVCLQGRGGPLRMPEPGAIRAIRAGLAPEILVRFDEELDDYISDVEAIDEVNLYDRDMRRHILGIARSYIEHGGPETAVPCPDCKDENGLSWGHDRSHPLWPEMCRRCHWHGYTGFGVNPASRPFELASA